MSVSPSLYRKLTRTKSWAKKISLLPLIAMTLATPVFIANAEPKKALAIQDQVARKKITELKGQLRSQSEQLSSLRNEVVESLKKQENQIQVLDQVTKDKIKEIDLLKVQNTHNSELSSDGAIILLVGLLIEILGALLLGAPVLATKIEELSDFELDPSLDMVLHAPKKEAVLAFYSMIGNILLFLGFTAQFTGTALLLNVDWRVQLAIVLSVLAIVFLVLVWLLGIDPKQSRLPQLAFVCKNIMRVSKLKTSNILFRGRQCQLCLKKVEKKNSYIFWYDQGNFPTHPFLHPPSQFLVGHEDCMSKKISQKIADQANFEQQTKIQPHLQKLKGSDFISIKLDEYKKWFADHYDHWLKIRSDWPKPSKHEIEMDAAVEKIKRIDS
jgi:hypothetical protein